MMDSERTMQASVFRLSTAEVLDRAERGEITVVTRDGEPVAVVIGYAEWRRLNATINQG